MNDRTKCRLLGVGFGFLCGALLAVLGAFVVYLASGIIPRRLMDLLPVCLILGGIGAVSGFLLADRILW